MCMCVFNSRIGGDRILSVSQFWLGGVCARLHAQVCCVYVCVRVRVCVCVCVCARSEISNSRIGRDRISSVPVLAQ